MEANELAKVFGENVRKYRNARKWTQATLSEEADIPQPDISDIEQGKRKPNLATIAKLAEAFEIPAAELFSGQALTTT